MADSASRRFRTVTDEVASIPLRYPHPGAWWTLFLVSIGLLVVFAVAVAVLFARGVGVWGNNIPVNWGIAISNYVWWLGIGQGGTLISALLLLVAQHWRNSLNRFAETVTVFAVICAGVYPILHLGRPQRFYWMAPYPSTMGVWPQFKSPLAWDFVAVVTYLTVSIVFWYVGAIPDLAAVRDRARTRGAQVFYGVLALGWRGGARHWSRWRQSYRLCAALAVPLVVSFHSEVSLLMSAGPIPGWASTVFPAHFVAGAAYSGFAVVAMLSVVLRGTLGLQDLVTDRHFDMLGKMMLTMGLLTAYGYFAEAFTALYSGDPHELVTLHDRLGGRYDWSYWGAVILNFVPLQLMWMRRFRLSPAWLFLVGLSGAAGMWLERYMLVVSTLYRDDLVSSWGVYHASPWEWALFAGSIGLFMTGFLLFVRVAPLMSAFEIKAAIFEGEESVDV